MNDYSEIESAQKFSLDIPAFLFIFSNLEKIRNIFKLLTKFPLKNVCIYHKGVLLIVVCFTFSCDARLGYLDQVWHIKRKRFQKQTERFDKTEFIVTESEFCLLNLIKVCVFLSFFTTHFKRILKVHHPF